MAPKPRIQARFHEHLRAHRAETVIESAVLPTAPFEDVPAMMEEADPWGWMQTLLDPRPAPKAPLAEALVTDSVEPGIRRILNDLDGALASGRSELAAIHKKLKAAHKGSSRASDLEAFLAIVQETWALMGALKQTSQDEFPARAKAA